MRTYQTKRIELPGGKFIEVVVFGDDHIETATTVTETEAQIETDVQADVEATPERELPAQTAGAATTHEHTELHVCPRCAGELVYPVRWEERRGEAWEITLRCPNCEWWHSGEYGDEAVDRFDDVLNEGTEMLLSDLRTFARVNMEEDVERLVKAINTGLIQPIDF